MTELDTNTIDPDGIHYLDLTGLVSVSTLDVETGEIEEIDNPTEHSQRTKVTGRQVLEMRQRLADGKPAVLSYAVRDKELLMGGDGELIEADSAIPPGKAA